MPNQLCQPVPRILFAAIIPSSAPFDCSMAVCTRAIGMIAALDFQPESTERFGLGEPCNTYLAEAQGGATPRCSGCCRVQQNDKASNSMPACPLPFDPPPPGLEAFGRFGGLEGPSQLPFFFEHDGRLGASITKFRWKMLHSCWGKWP